MSEVSSVELRTLQIDDYRGFRKSMVESYKEWEEDYWEEHHIEKLLDIFPEGQICVLADGKIAGCALSLIINYDDLDDDHTYDEVIANYSFETHAPDGNVLYGIDVFIHPEYRGLRLGRRLYDARKDLCERLNLKSIIAGGRIPNYNKYADEMTPKQYIENVRHKEIFDPVLSFQLANDFHVKKVLKNYLTGDTESLEYATLLEWNNIYYTKEEKDITQPKSEVRLGLIQWQMRLFNDFESLCEQMEFFVDTLGSYNCDFALFPELFNAPLMAFSNEMKESEAIRALAGFTIPLKDKLLEYAISYNVNIITGSMPLIKEDGHLYNVGYLCRRNGTFEQYEKIHITPNEQYYWGMVGGNEVKVFDTDAGKIGVLICYDVEFPELPRLMADEGLQILFVPYLTDTQNGYTRVASCARARAIENECYVAIAGGVGNLPKVQNMDIQYGQASVFTPSDFAFPNNGVKAEATPNTEMTLIADVDLDLLKRLHNYGSVKNLKDRRKDLYTLKWNKK
ncbi:bifunctional GNAT family N-acetyltransferase/carbon-nitrogen hydrolase family protein [Marinigracilibium pacificum]|uniref:GNAT family N-acetyltransferase n=1 Tax=Marinigracilibium pacificum TaxID=2729599 RepID=A0A848IUU9_9BACT|nr:bifunctional GNAT family N-acetyltransferase/carbon-nitrogen hydrolase family protein [Marinigracilibium pacificum]NMM47466.1 GNAT family N-acetyltransferase [Marinigracilibium pacificum]